ncbi:hypothetical protein C5B42_01645 [Candidatus Cerribacteria bacterium 'Amazon FNV 2010 28 9']|uniref:Uncharacterized protein n=1 Tax=Candidatus Cerribacteria bacterium 'Amazon FNV 2010 28 9' TaxID=2081795 RepID=A0A317JPY7_9BACT|nr:MAG: hypothetical protein C5B42_01645 [Candidatus Cerribacteria bacterium 'Amazon FNV 2010 28 9']
MTDSSSFKAIELTRAFFELVNGEVGLLKFNIDELTELPKATESDPEKWEVVCSFIESLGSSVRSKYKVTVNINNNTLIVKKISPLTEAQSRAEGAWQLTPKNHGDNGARTDDSGSKKAQE